MLWLAGPGSAIRTGRVWTEQLRAGGPEARAPATGEARNVPAATAMTMINDRACIDLRFPSVPGAVRLRCARFTERATGAGHARIVRRRAGRAPHGGYHSLLRRRSFARRIASRGRARRQGRPAS